MAPLRRVQLSSSDSADAPHSKGVLAGLRLPFLLYNCVLVVSGLLHLALGVWVHQSPLVPGWAAPARTAPAPLDRLLMFALMLGGSLSAVTALVGFILWAGRSRLHVGVYLLFVVMVILGNLAVAALSFHWRAQGTFVQRPVTEVLARLQVSREYRQGLNTLQLYRRCCGVRGPGDYSTLLNSTLFHVPTSCCVLHANASHKTAAPWTVLFSDFDYDACIRGFPGGAGVRQAGCAGRAAAWLRLHTELPGGAGLAALLLLLAGLLVGGGRLLRARRGGTEKDTYTL